MNKDLRDGGLGKDGHQIALFLEQLAKKVKAQEDDAEELQRQHRALQGELQQARNQLIKERLSAEQEKQRRKTDAVRIEGELKEGQANAQSRRLQETQALAKLPCDDVTIDYQVYEKARIEAAGLKVRLQQEEGRRKTLVRQHEHDQRQQRELGETMVQQHRQAQRQADERCKSLEQTNEVQLATIARMEMERIVHAKEAQTPPISAFVDRESFDIACREREEGRDRILRLEKDLALKTDALGEARRRLEKEEAGRRFTLQNVEQEHKRLVNCVKERAAEEADALRSAMDEIKPGRGEAVQGSKDVYDAERGMLAQANTSDQKKGSREDPSVKASTSHRQRSASKRPAVADAVGVSSDPPDDVVHMPTLNDKRHPRVSVWIAKQAEGSKMSEASSTSHQPQFTSAVSRTPIDEADEASRVDVKVESDVDMLSSSLPSIPGKSDRQRIRKKRRRKARPRPSRDVEDGNAMSGTGSASLS